MNKNCQLHCPIAQACFTQHEALTQTQQELKQSWEFTRDQYDDLRQQYAYHSDEITFEELAIQLIGDGIQLDCEPESAINQSLENLSHYQRMRQNIAERLGKAAATKAYYDEKYHANLATLANSRRAMDLIGRSRSNVQWPAAYPHR